MPNNQSVLFFQEYEYLKTNFAVVSNETFFAAGSVLNFSLYLVQNNSASPEELSSITVQLTAKNLDFVGLDSINISNHLKNRSSSSHVDADTVKFDITDNLPANGYIEIKFTARVRPNLDPLALLQFAVTMNATASARVTYGPKYSTEVYTNYPHITFARTTQGGKIGVNLLLCFWNVCVR